MITIINRGPHTKDGKGWRNYEVSINGEVITTYSHVREHGLSICLARAADAVISWEQKQLEKLTQETK